MESTYTPKSPHVWLVSFAWRPTSQRNAWVFEHRRVKVEEVIQRVTRLVGEYERANEREVASRDDDVGEVEWVPPPPQLPEIQNK
ncbi:Cell division protein FtsB [Bienertia sinuspersici]